MGRTGRTTNAQQARRRVRVWLVRRRVVGRRRRTSEQHKRVDTLVLITSPTALCVDSSSDSAAFQSRRLVYKIMCPLSISESYDFRRFGRMLVK